MASKRTYHSTVVIGYILDFLPPEIKDQIPSSTAHNWKYKDLSQFFGYDWAMATDDDIQTFQKLAQYKKLIKVTKALVFIIETYKTILSKSELKKTRISSKQSVVKCIDKVKDVIGMNRSAEIFNISGNQFFRWKQIKACRL